MSVVNPTGTHRTLLAMFEEELDEPAKLIRHLDGHAPGGWDAHTPAHVSVLHEVAIACLEPRRRSRAELADVLPKLEDIRRATLALGPNVPARYLCPIRQEVMEDPVIAADGHTYERVAIAQWLVVGINTPPLTSPVSGMRLPHMRLTPAIELRQLIRDFLEANPGA